MNNNPPITVRQGAPRPSLTELMKQVPVPMRPPWLDDPKFQYRIGLPVKFTYKPDYGIGEISDINPRDLYGVTATFKLEDGCTQRECFTLDGRYRGDDREPTLVVVVPPGPIEVGENPMVSIGLDFEYVKVNEDDTIGSRAKIPGGWLIRLQMKQGTIVTTTFIPDPNHEWEVL